MNEILDRQDFLYVYRVTGRKDGMEYFFQDTARISAGTLASFRDAVDAQRWVDALRAKGERVHVMPSAEGIVR